MAEYKVIYRDEAPGWQPGCPARLVAVQVSRNTQSGACYLQARVDNLLATPIEALEAQFTVTSPEGTQSVTIEQFDAAIAPATTAALPPQPLSCHEVTAVAATVARVNDARGFAPVEPLPHVRPLVLSDKAVAELHAEAPQLPAKLVRHQEHDGWWLCCCGRLNVGHEACGSCGSSVSSLSALEDEAALEHRADAKAFEAAKEDAASDDTGKVEAALKALESLGGFEGARELIEATRPRLAELRARDEAAAQAAKKRNRKIGIAAGAMAAVALVAYLVVGVALPQMRQAKIDSLIEAGQYDELAEMLDANNALEIADALKEEGNTEAAGVVLNEYHAQITEEMAASFDASFEHNLSVNGDRATFTIRYTGEKKDNLQALVTWQNASTGLILSRETISLSNNTGHELNIERSSKNPDIRVVVYLDGDEVYSEDVNF